MGEVKRNNCKDDCDKLVRCDNCGKQLCNLEEMKNANVIRNICTNDGYYHIGDETICVDCHVFGNKKSDPSTFSEILFPN